MKIGDSLSQAQMQDIFAKLKLMADKNAYNAGMGGEYGDRGSSQLLKEVEIYKAGVAGKFPKEWEQHLKEIDPITSTEYKMYLDLKKKFG